MSCALNCTAAMTDDRFIEHSQFQQRKSIESEIQDLKTSLSNQEEVNSQLQKYIDSVILNIMEKHPELLEVTKQGNKK